MITADEIRARYLSRLRSLWKSIGRMEQMYAEFPNAPPEAWRNGITAVAKRIREMPDAELLETKGIDMALRNLVADQMGIPRCTPDGHNYGHRILDVSWG